MPFSGKEGGATPFDTGSLEPSTRTGFSVLQPWKVRQAQPDECWEVLQGCVGAVAGFRGRFERWLLDSYDDPDRYLETIPDRFAAGQPDRLDPGWLRAQRDARTRALCRRLRRPARVDLELHIEGELGWSELLAVQVPWEEFQIATEWVRHVDAVHGVEPEVLPLPYGEPADPDRPYDALYAESGRVLRERLEAPAP